MRLNVDGLLVYFPYDYIYPEQESHPVYTCMRSALDMVLANTRPKKMFNYFLLQHLPSTGESPCMLESM